MHFRLNSITEAKNAEDAIIEAENYMQDSDGCDWFDWYEIGERRAMEKEKRLLEVADFEEFENGNKEFAKGIRHAINLMHPSGFIREVRE